MQILEKFSGNRINGEELKEEHTHESSESEYFTEFINSHNVGVGQNVSQ